MTDRTILDRAKKALQENERTLHILDHNDNGRESIRRGLITVGHELRELITVLELGEDTKP